MLRLYGHPFSSYTWKVLIALWETGTAFDYRSLAEEGVGAEFAAIAPFGKFPLLVDGDRVVAESSIIIEHLQIHHPGHTAMIPADPAAALEVRLLDRLSDTYLMNQMQVPVSDRLRDEGSRDPLGVARAREGLGAAYRWWDGHMAGRTWAAGEAFTLADCAAAPALFYGDWVQPIPDALVTLKAYRARLLARPSVRRAVDEARPFRSFFPLGAPDRD
ncbi:glutathione S-transferase family protein [Sphingomonas jatrophae]|uniref:Glutathione S-transferase n=1 Tax=Sphingomonas jatrophae TaxID=1166337 RepID=A0A1I6LDX5_9SPHN|nr:glutathione S-transferase family protein [Sphingomonas jatrophae]SFS01604.1 glutathione S-transferase [Sphingomonas jatrophae]